MNNPQIKTKTRVFVLIYRNYITDERVSFGSINEILVESEADSYREKGLVLPGGQTY